MFNKKAYPLLTKKLKGNNLNININAAHTLGNDAKNKKMNWFIPTSVALLMAFNLTGCFSDDDSASVVTPPDVTPPVV